MTRLLFLLVLTLFLTVSGSVAQALFRLDSLPPEGILLDKGWKWHSGDNLEWTKANFADYTWQSIDLHLPAYQLPEITSGNIGWLRLQFAVDSGLRDTLLALLITQYGSSEIYLDGKLIRRLGKVGSPDHLQPYNPHNDPIPLPLDKQSTHLLAIRFASAAPVGWIRQRTLVSPIILRLKSFEAAITDRDSVLRQSRTTTGIAFLTGAFGLLFLLLYGFYPQQQLNLFFGLFSLFDCLSFIISMLLTEGSQGLTGYGLLSYALDFIYRVNGSTIMVFISLALYHRIRRPYLWLILCIFVDFPLAILYPSASIHLMIDYLMRFLWPSGFLWLMMDAFRSKKREDWLVGLVAFSSVLVNLCFPLLFFTGIDIFAFTLSLSAIITFPAMIIYLALRYGRTNISLAQQLIQVQLLSEKSLQQEKEKQQMLATQNETLEQQVTDRTLELTHQKEELQSTLEHLKATQIQLIQSEKMASLGELTAGIAHEIQNPMNFVNNFAEVSTELVQELREEIKADNKEEALTIADDLTQNLSKIHHHGQRADSIVKGMLQHSRASTGEKQLTDLNALADEYLRLSYHGLRAKDKDFNAKLLTHFDEQLGKVEVVPQDLGRVLLNLFNNAFYAVMEKNKHGLEAYQPEVSVSTKHLGDKVEICVRDNGVGIPSAALGKIYQPFFTTKPTGQGTGLGLSLSYDIITKGHGGELKVETQEGQYTEFIITLPKNNLSRVLSELWMSGPQ